MYKGCASERGVGRVRCMRRVCQSEVCEVKGARERGGMIPHSGQL